MTALADRKVEAGAAPAYALGYSDAEFRRLEQQGAFFRDLTEDVMRRAGIKTGQRVLDVGCGVGDVSLLVGELVGPTGTVLGIDRSADGIEVARRRAAAAGLSWVSFETAELDDFATTQRFDAIVGRLVLAYLPDPVHTLRHLTGFLSDGGIVAFQEVALPLIRCVPPTPLFTQCSRWVTDTFAAAGFDIDMGGKLFAAFTAAGLPPPQMITGGRAAGGPDSPIYDYTTGMLRSLLPMAERCGIATAAEIGIDTLAERLRQETLAHRGCIMLPPLVGAWTRKSSDDNGVAR